MSAVIGDTPHFPFGQPDLEELGYDWHCSIEGCEVLFHQVGGSLSHVLHTDSVWVRVCQTALINVPGAVIKGGKHVVDAADDALEI